MNALQRWAVKQGFWLDSLKDDGAEISSLLQSIQAMAIREKLIRVGPNRDGGYVVPEEIFAVDGLISPGVGFSNDFDTSLAEHGVPVLMIDHTVTKPPGGHESFRFRKMELSPFDSATEISLDSAVAAMGAGQNLALQMDIEGSEWAVIGSTSQRTLDSFKVMVIEFHNFHKLVTSAIGLATAKNVFRKLLTSHGVAHAHVNNCCKGFWRPVSGASRRVYTPSTFELTLVRRDSFHFTGHVAKLPSSLDWTNLAAKPKPTMPEEWLSPPKPMKGNKGS
jgi:hypothetical protein